MLQSSWLNYTVTFSIQILLKRAVGTTHVKSVFVFVAKTENSYWEHYSCQCHLNIHDFNFWEATTYAGKVGGKRELTEMMELKISKNFLVCVLFITYHMVLHMLYICTPYFMDNIRNFTRVILITCSLFLEPHLELTWNTRPAGLHHVGCALWPARAPGGPGPWFRALKG